MDSKKYEETYRKRLLKILMEFGSRINPSSSIMADQLGKPSLLNVK